MRRGIETCVHDMYNEERYKLAYEGVIHPIPDSSTWDRVECTHILPPTYKRGPGGQRRLGKRVLKSQRIKGL